jgi:hypothetical protein
MAAWADNPRAMTDKALILFRPFNNFDVTGTGIHEFDT